MRLHFPGSDRRLRPGISSLELLVSGGLILTIMAATLPLFVAHQRLIAMTDRDRLAVEELANQAERLQATPPGKWNDAIAALQPSPLTIRRLPNVRLAARQSTTSLGERVILEIRWNDPGRQQHPLRLAVWRPPSAAEASPQ